MRAIVRCLHEFLDALYQVAGACPQDVALKWLEVFVTCGFAGGRRPPSVRLGCSACRHVSRKMNPKLSRVGVTQLIGIDTLTLEQRERSTGCSQFVQRQLSHRSENYALRSDIVYGSAD